MAGGFPSNRPPSAVPALAARAERTLGPFAIQSVVTVLNRRNKALRAPASCAFINMMHEAGLLWLRFGAGEAHLCTAFHAQRLGIERSRIASFWRH
jgi:hypothetical protein